MKKTIEIRTPQWVTLVFVSLVLTIWLLFGLGNFGSLMSMFDIHQYPFRWIAGLLFVFGAPLFAMHLAFTRTLFAPNEIFHRNLFCRTRSFSYDDIKDLGITRHNSLLIRFQDGKKLTVHTGADRLPDTIALLKERSKSYDTATD